MSEHGSTHHGARDSFREYLQNPEGGPCPEPFRSSAFRMNADFCVGSFSGTELSQQFSDCSIRVYLNLLEALFVSIQPRRDIDRAQIFRRRQTRIVHHPEI